MLENYQTLLTQKIQFALKYLIVKENVFLRGEKNCLCWHNSSSNFDFLVSYFKSPNDLAESLTISDVSR